MQAGWCLRKEDQPYLKEMILIIFYWRTLPGYAGTG